MRFSTRAALRVALIYGVAASCWILFTDQLFGQLFLTSPLGISPAWWQSLKGLFFVAVTSLLLYSLLGRQFRALLRASDRYRESEHRWERLLNQTPEPVLILNDSRIVYTNQAGIDILGASKTGAVVGKRVHEFIVDVAEDDEELDDPTSDDSETARLRQYVIQDPRGEIRTVEAHSSAITFEGEPCTMSVWRDVTRRKQFERELVAARNEAENASRIKSTILANLSHEIRTPLTAILGFADLLEQDPDAPVDEGVRLIQSSGERLRDTLESILTLAELEGGDAPYHPEPLDIRDAVRSAAEVFSGQARRRGLSFSVTTPDEPVWAYADSSALSRIVMNLVSNAVKFTDYGGVSVSVAPDGRRALVEVSDTGIGISEKFLPLIFDEFVQASQGLDRAYEGAGLGLTIVRQLVNLHGGSIDVESRMGSGTRIKVAFPRIS